MKRLAIITMSAIILVTAAGYAVVLDFSGRFDKLPSITDPWCGRSIELKKIRLNKYRISWELLSGEVTTVVLQGTLDGDTIDFRNKNYGYTYTLTDNKNRLVVNLTVPNKTIVCEFTRTVHAKK